MYFFPSYLSLKKKKSKKERERKEEGRQKEGRKKRSSHMAEQIKDPALLQLLLRFNPWPGNIHMPQMWTKK